MRIEITIKRPEGDIERVITEKFGDLNQALWQKMINTTRAAGRGECLSYKKIIEKRIQRKRIETSNNGSLCPRCNSYCYGDCLG